MASNDFEVRLQALLPDILPSFSQLIDKTRPHPILVPWKKPLVDLLPDLQQAGLVHETGGRTQRLLDVQPYITLHAPLRHLHLTETPHDSIQSLLHHTEVLLDNLGMSRAQP